MKKPEPRILSVNDVTKLRQTVIDAVEELDATNFCEDNLGIIERMFDSACEVVYGSEFLQWIENRTQIGDMGAELEKK